MAAIHVVSDLEMPPVPSTMAWYRARERLAALLQAGDTMEAGVLELIAECPYVFSRVLPVRSANIALRPVAAPGSSEVDFILYPKQDLGHPAYGIIERRRPKSYGLDGPTLRTVTSSKEVTDAAGRGAFSLDGVDDEYVDTERDAAIAGTRAIVFVIMGLSDKAVEAAMFDVMSTLMDTVTDYDDLVASFDALFTCFESATPPKIVVLEPFPSEEIGTEVYDYPILLSNYEASHVEMLQELWEAFGEFRNCHYTHLPSEILDICREKQPRLIVRDYHYLDMSGSELTRAIKSIEGMETVRHLLFPPRGLDSGSADEVLVEANSMGGKDLIYEAERLLQDYHRRTHPMA